MRIQLFCFVLFFSQLVFTQDNKLDSLFDGLEEYDQKAMDSVKKVVAVLWYKDLDSAELMVGQMLKHAKKFNSKVGLGQSYSYKAGTYSFQGKIGQSIAFYIKAAKIFEELQDEKTLAKLNFNIGIGFLDLDQFKNSHVYIKKAHDFYLKNCESENVEPIDMTLGYDLNTSYLTLAHIDIMMSSNLETILNNLKYSEELAIKRRDTSTLCRTLNVKGDALIRYNNPQSGINQINKSLRLIKDYQPDNNFVLAHSYLYLSYAYSKIKRFDKALSYNDSSITHFSAMEYLKGLKNSYDNRKTILENQGKYKQSIEAYNIFNKYKDSLLNKEQVNRIDLLKTQFETEQIKREKETAEKSAEINALQSTKNRSLFIGSAIIAGLILLSSLFYFGRLKAKKKAELVTLELKETQKRLAIEKQYRDSELKALKAQMDPHFIFNALNSIQEYIVLNQKNLASDYLGKFADLMRKYLHHSDKGSISIQEEANCLNTYLELEKVRFEDSLNYTITITDNIDKEQTYIPTMIIQPYVENALKHGLLHKKHDRQLDISISKKDNCIECVVMDNGIGRARSKEIQNKRKKHHKSFATNATEDRLELLNFGKDHKIGVKTEDLFNADGIAKGTRVVMTIPYKNV